MHPIGKALPARGYFFEKNGIGPEFYGEVGDVIRRFRKSQDLRGEGIAHFGQELAGSAAIADVSSKARSPILPRALGAPDVPLC